MDYHKAMERTVVVERLGSNSRLKVPHFFLIVVFEYEIRPLPPSLKTSHRFVIQHDLAVEKKCRTRFCVRACPLAVNTSDRTFDTDMNFSPS